MKQVCHTFLFILLIGLLSACSTGYISSPEAVKLKTYLQPENLLQLTENPDPQIWIIDVRPYPAYRAGHIPTAKNYPSSGIMKRLDELPQTQYLIFYCETGGRAQSVIKKMEEKGYSLMMNWGGNTRWPYDRNKSD